VAGFAFLVSRGRLASAFSQVVEAEVFEFLAATADLKSDDGCQRVVRHGHLPERQIMTVIACATGRRAPTIRRASASCRQSCRPTPGVRRASIR